MILLVAAVITAALAAATLVAPPSALAQAQAEVTYQTRNGPRSAAQLQSELAAAGYSGPWDGASMVAAYDRAGLPSIDPYPSDLTWSCFATNPSCGRDPWWAEWNEAQDSTHATYSAIGSHFVTERRFAEVTDLLWQWPEGKALLQQADGSGVLVISLSYDHQAAFATYSPQRKLIAVNSRILTAPTWMVADVLAHELSHASDDARGVNQDGTSAACLAGETTATLVQQRFLVWLTRTLEPQGLPSVAVVSGRLVDEQAALARDLFAIGFSTDIPNLVSRAYDGTC